MFCLPTYLSYFFEVWNRNHILFYLALLERFGDPYGLRNLINDCWEKIEIKGSVQDAIVFEYFRNWYKNWKLFYESFRKAI